MAVNFSQIVDGEAVSAATVNPRLQGLDDAIEDIKDGTAGFTLMAMATATTLTISSGAITVTNSYHVVAAEAGVADDLDTITAAKVRTFLILTADAGDTITIKHGTGNIDLQAGEDLELSGNDSQLLFWTGTAWVDLYCYPYPATPVIPPPPACWTMWHDEAVVIAGNALQYYVDQYQAYQMVMYQHPPADADSFEIGCFLQAGTYDFNVLGYTASNNGKLDWYIREDGGAYGAAFATGQDWYDAAGAKNVVKTETPVVIATSGAHVLKGVVNGKNGSSSGYYIPLSKYWFTPNGGY